MEKDNVMQSQDAVAWAYGVTRKFVRRHIRRGTAKIHGKTITNPTEPVELRKGLIIQLAGDRRTVLYI